MIYKIIYRIRYSLSLILFFCVFSSSAQDFWQHGISLGYGNSKDTNHSQDTNSGFLLSADLFPLGETPWLSCFLNASLGEWFSSVSAHSNTTTGALSLSFRGYLAPSKYERFNPYLLATAGPSYLSNRILGQNEQGANVAFQLAAGAGVEFLKNNHGLDLNIRFVHFSNADIFTPNAGFNFLYLVSLGYLF